MLFSRQEHFPCFYNEVLHPRFTICLKTFVCLVAIGSHGCFFYCNFDGIRDDDKRARIFEYLRSLKYDFYLLQETHVQTEDIEVWSAQ